MRTTRSSPRARTSLRAPARPDSVAGRVALAVLLGCAIAATVDAQPRQSFWGLVINDVPRGEVLAALDGERFWLPVAVLEEAGLRRFDGRRDTLFGEPHVLLSSLEPEIVAKVDTANVVLHVDAAARFFDETVVTLQRSRPDGIHYSQNTSAFLNYSVTWDQTTGTTGYGESGVALFGNTSIASSFDVGADGQFVRRLSTMTVDRPGKRQRLQVGDIIPPVTPLGSGSLLAGVSFGRDYSIDPYYFQYPAPSVRGTATRPSDVEIYVNGALVRRIAIGPGPYRLDRLPLNTGLGNVRVVVRDRFGSQRTFQSALYLARGVLKRGEQDYQYAAGALRDDSGEKPTYGEWTGLARHRIGATDWLTVGFEGEASERAFSGGPTIGMRLRRAGEIELQASASETGDGQRGFAGYGVYTFASRFLNLGATAQYFGDRFANVYLEPGGASTPEFYQATAGAPLLTGSLNYTWETKRSPAANFGFTLPDGSLDDAIVRSRSHSLRATFRVLPGTQISATGTMTRVLGEQQWSAFASVNVGLTKRVTASVTYSEFDGRGSTYADIDRALPAGVGYGYRVTASDLDDGTGSAQFEVNMRHSHFQVAYDATQGGEQRSGSATMAGGLIVNRAGAFLTRELESSAAVVEVSGLKNVRIMADNVEIGRTNRWGRLLVPQLLPYLANRVSYEDADVPFDFTIPLQSQLIAPPFRGVAYVKFPTTRILGRAGTIRILDGAIEIVPAFGSIRVRLADGDVESPLNGDGEFFLNLPDGRHTAIVTFRGKSCDAALVAVTTRDMVQQLGRLWCEWKP